jgi:FkbM family methyltransferase
MLDKKLCTLTGFEPQPAALDRLLESKSDLETYLPYAIGDGGEHRLHMCKAPGMTSLLKPDTNMLSLFNLFSKFGAVTGTENIKTHRLDDIAAIRELDFLKIDVQGAELSVFQNGSEKLAKAVAIQTEISFLPLYENQPVFGEIDLELRAQGFVPHCFAGIKRWAIAPMIVDNNPRRGINQLLEADMVYVRDFSDTSALDNEQLKHLALIAHHCYRSFDLAAYLILELTKRKAVSSQGMPGYCESLRK